MTRVTYVCDGGPWDPIDQNPTCPDANQHTPSPSGYVAASEWAEEMARTRDQQQCPGCGLWLIWTPRPEGTP